MNRGICLTRIHTLLLMIPFFFSASVRAMTPIEEFRTRADWYAIFFIDETTGVAAGKFGAMINTRDGGETWAEIEPVTESHLQAVHFISEQTGFAAGSGGSILKTEDGGDSWRVVPSGTDNDLFSLVFVNENTGYAAGRSGAILKTADGGETWVKLKTGVKDKLNSMDFAGPDTGIAVGKKGRIIRTTDGGQTWRSIASGTTAELNAVRFLEDGATALAAGAKGAMLKSVDRGETWHTLAPVVKKDLLALSFADDMTVGFAVGKEGTILKTADRGDTWEIIYTGTIKNFYSVHVSGNGLTGYISGRSGYVLKTTDGDTWSFLRPDRPRYSGAGPYSYGESESGDSASDETWFRDAPDDEWQPNPACDKSVFQDADAHIVEGEDDNFYIVKEDDAEKSVIVICDTKDHFSGVKAEYYYLFITYGRDIQLISQALVDCNGGNTCDLLEIEMPNGNKKEFYFDISDFFGKF